MDYTTTPMHPSHLLPAAPYPSPLIMGTYDYHSNNGDIPPFSPIAPVGSPFRFPYTQAHLANDSNANPNANAHSAGGGGGGGGPGPGGPGAPTPKVSSNNTLNNAIFLHWGAMSDFQHPPSSKRAFMPWARAYSTYVHLMQDALAVVLVTNLFHFLVPTLGGAGWWL
ncbi:hypothetical protein M378DRAFT_651915 [Amanita muscaria Koide BX008]|uniref:Uncharacterized protein n=1 Tax=Amanita muscaria (strain Koide BX008) TaxID=946122 RepID=A0A0C2SME0_AMAMK|nr:hypothetical protein M378DRAFT_651915 [Amanita muscaria Koide BX008]